MANNISLIIQKHWHKFVGKKTNLNDLAFYALDLNLALLCLGYV